jgi:hypothetical protein
VLAVTCRTGGVGSATAGWACHLSPLLEVISIASHPNGCLAGTVAPGYTQESVPRSMPWMGNGSQTASLSSRSRLFPIGLALLFACLYTQTLVDPTVRVLAVHCTITVLYIRRAWLSTPDFTNRIFKDLAGCFGRPWPTTRRPSCPIRRPTGHRAAPMAPAGSQIRSSGRDVPRRLGVVVRPVFR